MNEGREKNRWKGKERGKEGLEISKGTALALPVTICAFEVIVGRVSAPPPSSLRER